MRNYKIICELVGYGRQIFFRSGTSKIDVRTTFMDEMLSQYKVIIRADITEII
jgi:hypothetical protein